MLYELYQRLATSVTFKRRLLLFMVATLLLLTFLWIDNHAFITISVDTPSSTALSYSLFDQHNQKSQRFSSPAHTVKRLVRRGSHEIMAQQGETSFFAISHTGGFLTTTHVSGTLLPENSRQFVGNNPSGCMQYINKVLLSYDCGSATVSSLRLHLPATQDLSTYTINSNADALGADAGNTVEGIVTTPQGTFVLSQVAAARSVGAGTHVLQQINPDLSYSQGQALTDLDPSKTYTMYGYKDGFLVVDQSFSQFFYYPTATSPPTILNIGVSANKDFTPFTSSFQNNGFVVGYSSSDTEGVGGNSAAGGQGSKSQIIVSQNGQGKLFDFNKQFGSASLCGLNRLCLLNNKQLEVYDISGKKPKLLFEVSDVLDMQNTSNSLLITRDKEILSFDTTKKQGFSSYTFGDYASCGIRVDGTQYTVCATNNKHEKVALQFNLNTPNTGSIDKKIAKLLKYNEVDDISAYGSYVYIVPNYGPTIYDKATQKYIQDPAEVKRINNILNQDIDKAGIDRSTYHLNAF